VTVTSGKPRLPSLCLKLQVLAVDHENAADHCTLAVSSALPALDATLTEDYPLVTDVVSTVTIEYLDSTSGFEVATYSDDGSDSTTTATPTATTS
jgi:hypothetical protein